ncbi:MAG: Ycf48-like protein [Ignavibacteria bacterium]|nr:Ycf48-like protein [Ignavibacteria bacterium]
MKSIKLNIIKFISKIFIPAISVAQLFFVFNTNVFSQTYSWYRIPNSPFSFPGFSDVCFINENTGWITTYNGILFRTNNAGANWTKLDSIFIGDFYGVQFINENTGFVCSFNSAYVLLKTTNGGLDLFKVDLPNPAPQGIESIHALNENFIYGCGRSDGYPNFIKSSDGGNNWQTKDMSQYANTLDDIHFINENTGIISGGIGSQPEYRGSIILQTTDGGNNWSVKYLGGRNRETGKRICFVNNSTGFVSLERIVYQERYFIKTTDGGSTWIQILLPFPGMITQGIGFINSTTGWIGGDMENTIGTTDGGLTWFNSNIGTNVHRFQMFGDTLGFAASQYIYKYGISTGISFLNSETPVNFRLHQNYPNPFNPVTKIKFDVFKTSNVSIKVFDNLGKETAVLLNQKHLPGSYEIEFDGSKLGSGIYFYQLEADNFQDVKKMILIR